MHTCPAAHAGKRSMNRPTGTDSGEDSHRESATEDNREGLCRLSGAQGRDTEDPASQSVGGCARRLRPGARSSVTCDQYAAGTLRTARAARAGSFPNPKAGVAPRPSGPGSGNVPGSLGRRVWLTGRSSLRSIGHRVDLTHDSGVTMTGSSTQGIKTVLHPVSDLATAKAVYAALLGVPPQTDGSYYVGFEAAGQHIGLVPGGGPQGMTSPVAYWHVPDIEAKLADVTAAGATVKEPVRDVGGGRLVATVTDPDGNVLGLLQDR